MWLNRLLETSKEVLAHGRLHREVIAVDGVMRTEILLGKLAKRIPCCYTLQRDPCRERLKPVDLLLDTRSKLQQSAIHVLLYPVEF
jgi:hypothetical protein